MVGLSDQAGLNQVQDFVAPVLVGLASENPEEQSGQQHFAQQGLDLCSIESPVAKLVQEISTNLKGAQLAFPISLFLTCLPPALPDSFGSEFQIFLWIVLFEVQFHHDRPWLKLYG